MIEIKKYLNRKNKPVILICVVFLVMLFITLTFGKYAYSSILNYYFKSKGCYFTSDSLNINTQHLSNLEWDGSDITFNLKNNINDSMITNYDISYLVTCNVKGDESEYISCSINNTENNTYNGILSGYETCLNNTGDNVDVSSYHKQECELKGYDWIEEPSTKNITFNLNLKDNTKQIKDVEVEIIAESTSPYKERLVGVYKLHKIDLNEEQIITTYQDYGDYGRINITNSSSFKKCIKIGWDSTLFKIDSDISSFKEYKVDSNDYIKEIMLEIDKKSNSSYKLYKTVSENTYNINDFNVVEEECK